MMRSAVVCAAASTRGACVAAQRLIDRRRAALGLRADRVRPVGRGRRARGRCPWETVDLRGEADIDSVRRQVRDIAEQQTPPRFDGASGAPLIPVHVRAAARRLLT